MRFLLTIVLFTFTTSLLFANEPSDLKRACDALSQNLDKPTIPTQRIVIGSMPNLLLPPEVYSECTGTYDTGVPDLGNCHIEDGGISRSCAQIPYCDVGWNGVTCGTREQCINTPNAPRTVCSSIIACNAYKTHKRFNVCEVAFTLKLPKFIEEPISKFIDSSYTTIESTRTEIRNALPLACANDELKQKIKASNNQSLADAVTEEIKRELEDRLRHEGEAWLQRTGIETLLASIPTGGLGGVAALSTNLADFVLTAKNIADDYVKIKEVKTFADDLNFSVNCHPGEWSDL
jgi:hypothetical protein